METNQIQTVTIPIHHKLTNPLSLIGIMGHAGAGKDTVAYHLHESFTDCWIEAFADPLKEAAAAAFGISVDSFCDPEYKESINSYWGVSPRQIAQFFGTDLFREHIWKLLENDTEDFWIRRMVGKLDNLLEGTEYIPEDTIVIPDVRFQNEYDFIVANGGIILEIVRPGADGSVGIPGHISERGITTKLTYSNKHQLIINSGTQEELYELVQLALIKSGYSTAEQDSLESDPD